jgi:hypothetical protein
MKSTTTSRLFCAQNTTILALVTAITAFAAGNLFAVNYQWDGGAATSNWQTGDNWNPNGTIGVFNTTAAHRLNVNSAQKLVYSAAEGTTVYANTVAASRGLVIGSGALGSGTMEITGGSFSTLGSTAGDVISNQDNATGRLIIGTNAGTGVGIGAGTNRVGIIDVLAGTATCAILNMNTTSATVNLDGGTLAVNKITRTGGTATLNLNGGTLKARQHEPAFVAGRSEISMPTAPATGTPPA